MKIIYSILLLAAFIPQISFSQSDGCSFATAISITTDCISPTAGTTTGATETIPGCTGTADDDVWYQFVATSNAHQIVVTPSGGMDPVVQLFSNDCATLTSLVCKDDGLTGITETINYNGLTIGLTYRVRIYDYYAGAGSGDFTICITTPPPAPSNDDCTAATPLNVNSSCSYTTATTDGASESIVGCSGSADDDVWFSFVATNSLQNIQVHPLDNLDLVFQVYSGSCANLSSISCVDASFTSQDEQSDIVGLVPGQTYYIRVYDYYQGNTGDFQICITGTPTPTPTNDEPCNAIQLPAVSATCQFSSFTTVGATASTTSPTPSSCAGGGGAAIGGFSASSSDVWFAITVPASGNLDITSQPNGASGAITDGVMALYSGTCGSLTQIACSDDNSAYPGSSNDLLPLISESGLTPGSTVYLRYWGFGTSTGTFGICASTATNDDCANALYICDINGYSASTSASYTADRPDNMRGNNEDVNGVNMPDGTNTGGIFGQAGSWGTGAPFFDVIINNNSWIKFTAASTTATLTVNIYDCWVGNYPSGGLQMQVFEGTNCSNFVPVSNFEESSTGFVITANNLTVGNDYYLMIDGYAGDICNYTITAESGVQFPDITDVPDICPGETVTLTAPPGATSYEWAHDGSTTQSVTVTPSTTQTYICEVSGLCDYKQTLDVVVTVKPNPVVSITNGSTTSICSGSSVDLTATGASTYVWSTSASTSTINVAPSAATTYTVTGTLNGCTDDASIDVSINALPTLSVSPTSVDSDCGATNGALNGATGSGTNPISYNWSNGSNSIGSNQNLTGIGAGTYYLTVTDGNMCSANFGPFSVSNPGAPPAPTVSIDNATPCVGNDAQLVATSSMTGASFNWSGPNSFTASTSTIDLTNLTNIDQGNYCVSATVAGCTGPSACQLVSLLNLPIIEVNSLGNDTSICINDDFQLTATGAVTYDWTGPNSFSATGSSQTIPNISSANQGYYTVSGTDANGCVGVDSVEMIALNLPVIDVSADLSSSTYCNGGIAELSASGAQTYSWTGPDNYTNSGNDITIFDLNAAAQGYYYVLGTDIESCVGMDSILLSVITDVPASSPSDTSLCPGEKLILYGSGGQSYVWSGPNGFYSEEQNPLISNDLEFSHSGWYTLTVVDSNGCLGYDSTLVQVTNSGGCLKFPNLITPNFDFSNDTWVVTGLDKFEFAEVSIFNRWGNLVYTSSPYNNDWGGEVNEGATIDGNNGKVPVGTYYYIVNLNEGEDTIHKGYIEVQY